MLQSGDAAGSTQCCAASQQSHGTAQAGEVRVLAGMGLGKNLYDKESGGRFKFWCTNKYGSCIQYAILTQIFTISNFNVPYFLKERSGPLFSSGPFSTQPLNEADLYTGPASIYTRTCSSHSGFL